jgi:hypothetical protein
MAVVSRRWAMIYNKTIDGYHIIQPTTDNKDAAVSSQDRRSSPMMTSTATTDEEKFKAVLKKALAINSKPTEESFPELPDVLLWIRFFLGIVCGTYFGLKGVRSGTMPLQCLNLICFVPLLYARVYLGAATEVFPSQVLFSGTFQALALSLLIWIYFFTAEHAEQEVKMIALLVLQSLPSNTGDVDSSMIPEEVQLPPPVVEESEF